MIPVVLIHNGNQDFLTLAIKQASKNNNVHLLTDGSFNTPYEKLTIVNSNTYTTDISKFRNVYIHLSSNGLEFERFCFERWFILKEYMHRNNLKTIFYIDSDVLLFTDVTKEWKKYNQYEMTLLHRSAAIASYITYEAISKFCNFILETYSNPKSYNFQKIQSVARLCMEMKKPGGVCDMTFLEHFHVCDACGGGPGRIGEMMQIIDDSMYDHNINEMDQDFEFSNGKKIVKVKDGIPYVFNTRLNKDIKFNSLHFQGGAKYMMREIYELCK